MTRADLPLKPLPPCDHDLEHVAYSVGHTGCLYRCRKCGGYRMRGEPNAVRN